MSTTYNVRSGDRISALAQRFGVNDEQLMRANGMNPALADGRVTSRRSDPDNLQIGQHLTIPSATPGYERTHCVKAGDTMTELAAHWGVSLEALLSANPQFDAARADGQVSTSRGARGTWDPDALRIGDTLQRPGTGQVDNRLPGSALGLETPAAPATKAPARPAAAKVASGSNAPLDGIKTTGASNATARQDKLSGGVDASRTMAKADQTRVMKYADRFEIAAAKYHLPPALLAGIASRESRGGAVLDASGFGDHGHGFGLMQVDDRNPGLRVATEGGPAGQSHINQAAGILRAKLDAVVKQYPNLSAQDQLRLAVSRYNGGSGTPAVFDKGTTGADYSSDVIARSQFYVSRWPGHATTAPARVKAPGAVLTEADRAPTEPPSVAANHGVGTSPKAGLPNTAGMSDAQKYDLYAQRVNASGDANARTDLNAGKRVILGLRIDTRIDANHGRGLYDDRLVVLWKDANGTKHVQEVNAATEPSSVYYSKGIGTDIDGKNGVELGRLREGNLSFERGTSSKLGNVLRPSRAFPVVRDTNHNMTIDSSDLTSAKGSDSFLFHKGGANNSINGTAYTGSAGCQTIPRSEWSNFWNALGDQNHFNYVLTNVTPK